MFKRVYANFYIACQRLQHKVFFGFIRGHRYLSGRRVRLLKSLVGKSNPDLVRVFENKFARLIGGGQGECVSYAGARMGFYELLDALNVGPGDEVILTGATCVVMANAIYRVGAQVIYVDIDHKTYGTSYESLCKVISPKTKVVVAQHTFGIACDIKKIADLCRIKKYFLIEDCALSVGSKFDGVILGNFGDAALFSTDHSKPINTIIGGLVYSNNIKLIHELRLRAEQHPDLPLNKQKALWSQFLIERWFTVASRYRWMALISFLQAIHRRVYSSADPFLSCDNGLKGHDCYPYPAKIPAFLALLGLYEIRRWPAVLNSRRRTLDLLLNLLRQNSKLIEYLPGAYHDNRQFIVPLRLVWSCKEAFFVERKLNSFIDISWIWFKRAIEGSELALSEYGYQPGCCPILEYLGSNIVNMPCNLEENNVEIFLGKVNDALVI